MEYIIKELPLDQLDCLSSILEEQQQYHFNLNGPYSERFLEVNIDTYQKYIRNNPCVKNAVFYVAQNAKEEIVAFCCATIQPTKEAKVEDLYVQELARSSGIGKQLLEKTLQWCKQNQSTRIEVHVSTGNEKVLPFYEQFGFQKTGYTLLLK